MLRQCLFGAMSHMNLDSHPLASFLGQITTLQVLYTLLLCYSREACREFLRRSLGHQFGQGCYQRLMCHGCAICSSTFILELDSSRLDLLDLSTASPVLSDEDVYICVYV